MIRTQIEEDNSKKERKLIKESKEPARVRVLRTNYSDSHAIEEIIQGSREGKKRRIVRDKKKYKPDATGTHMSQSSYHVFVKK